MEIKKNAIGRLTIDGNKHWNNCKDELCVVAMVSGENILFVFEDGTHSFYKKNEVLSLKAVKGLSTEARKVLLDAAKNYVALIKLDAEIDKLSKKKREIQSQIHEVKNAFAKASGFLTHDEFVKEVLKKLPTSLRNDIENYDYRLSVSYNGKSLLLERDYHIEKYFRSASFLYEEYDGTIQFCARDEDANYLGILTRYRKSLAIKPKLKDNLSLGDKDWLIYNGSYETPIKEFTLKGVDEVIKNLVK